MQACTKCCLEQPLEAFCSKRADRPCVTCLTCRAQRQPLQPGECRVARYNMKKRKRMGEAAYLELVAATGREWRAKNRDKLQRLYKRRRSNVDQWWKSIVQRARAVGIAMEDEEVLKARITQECHYCGYLPPDGERLNGLDRLDSSGIYKDDNTVACCAICNQMKAAMPAGCLPRQRAPHSPPQLE